MKHYNTNPAWIPLACVVGQEHTQINLNIPYSEIEFEINLNKSDFI